MIQQKATMKIFINEIFKTNFSIFDDYENTVKIEQIKKINYIEKIAHQLEKNLTDVNLFDILKNNNNIILASNSEINQSLINFDRTKYFGKDEKHEIKELNESQIDLVKKTFIDRLNKDKQTIENHMSRSLNNARDRLREHNDYMKKARENKEQLELIKIGDSTPIIDSINKVLADSRFTMKEMNENSNHIDFIIKDNIILTHKNDKANIDLRVDFGKYIIRIQFNSGITMNVICFEDNITYNGDYHPHVHNTGEVCLGNVKELFNEALMEGDLFAMVDITLSVLTNYNDDGPYESLADFARHSKQMQPNGEIFTIDTSPRFQDHTCCECEWDFEVEFEAEGISDYSESDCPECDSHNEFEYYYD